MRMMPNAAAEEAMHTIFSKCAELGLTGARIPEDDGGTGMSALTMGIMYEQLPPAIGLAVIAHEGTGARIYAASSPEQRERILPGIVAATQIACTGVSEPGVGSDPRSVKTRAVEDGDAFVIDGRKSWITNASVCDLMNVTCAAGTDDQGRGQMMRVVVERAARLSRQQRSRCWGCVRATTVKSCSKGAAFRRKTRSERQAMRPAC